jgi:hypothetical protein
MLNAQDSRTESSNSKHFRSATTAFLVLVVLGYAGSTQVEGASERGPVTAQCPQQEVAPATYYFPAHYVNQATVVEDHIQAF